MLGWPTVLYAKDPVLSMLHSVFLQLTQAGGVAAGGAAQGSGVNLAPLRDALAYAPESGRLFRAGEAGGASFGRRV